MREQPKNNDARKKLCSFSFAKTKETSEICDSVSLLIDEIVENRTELNLEMDAGDYVELINFPGPELAIDKLIELKKQSTDEQSIAMSRKSLENSFCCYKENK